MSVHRALVTFLTLQMVYVVRSQPRPPGSTDCTDCVTEQPEATTTLIPYTQCASNEYSIQGRCKEYTHELCSDMRTIGMAVTACNVSDSSMLRFLILYGGEERCTYYQRVFSCIVREVRLTMPLCTAAEIRFLQMIHLEELLEDLGAPFKLFLQLERCEVHSARVTLKLRDTNWTSIYSDKSSEHFWAYRDEYDIEISYVSANVFDDIYSDSAVTDIRQGTVLIDVTIFWSEATNLTSAEMTTMLQDGLNSSSIYGRNYDVESVDLVNKGLTCTVYGVTHKTGEMFRTRDLCNRCICSDGNVYCTSMACSAAWIGEYCYHDAECAVKNNTVCQDFTCQCTDQLFPVFSNSTRICGKKGVNSFCETSEDCDSFTECSGGICECLSYYYEVNNTCTVYAERLIAEEESMLTLWLVAGFSGVTVIVILAIMAVFVKRKQKQRKQNKPQKFTNVEEDGDAALPTTLHVNPYMSQRSLFKGKVSKHDMMGFDEDGEDGDSDQEAPTTLEEIDDKMTNPFAMSVFKDGNKQYVWNEDEFGGALPTALHVNPYLGGNNFYKGRLARPNLFGDFTYRDINLDSFDSPIPEPYTIGDVDDGGAIDDLQRLDILEEGSISELTNPFSMSFYNGDDDKRRRKLWNLAEHDETLPTTLHVNPYLTGNSFYKGRLAKPFLFGDFTDRSTHDPLRLNNLEEPDTHLTENNVTGDVTDDDNNEPETKESRSVPQGKWSKSPHMSVFKDDNRPKQRKLWNLAGHQDSLPTALHVNPYLTGNSFYKGRLSKPYMFGDFSQDTIHNPLTLNDLEDPTTQLEETYVIGDLDHEENEPHNIEFVEGSSATLPNSMSVFKDDNKKKRKLWNLTEHEGILPTTLHVNPHLTGHSFYKGRLAKPFMFGDFTDDGTNNPLRLNSLEASDTQVEETYTVGDMNDTPHPPEMQDPKLKLSNPNTMSVFTDEDTNNAQTSRKQIHTGDILPTRLHVNPHLTGHTFYKGKLAKTNMLGEFEGGDELNPYLSFA